MLPQLLMSEYAFLLSCLINGVAFSGYTCSNHPNANMLTQIYV